MEIEISKLPETMDEHRLEWLLDQLVVEAMSNKIGVEETIESMFEIIDRKQYTLRYFSPEMSEKVQKWIDGVWDISNKEITDSLCVIIVNIPTARGIMKVEDGIKSTSGEYKIMLENTRDEAKISMHNAMESKGMRISRKHYCQQ